MASRTLLISFACVLAPVATFVSCQQREQNAPYTVDKPLPAPPAGELKFAGSPPAHPFAKQAGNYFSRTVFETDGPGTTHIEVRDILVPPRAKVSVEAFPGPVVADPISGKATVSVGDKAQALEVGTAHSLTAGQALNFENSDPSPAMIRLYVIRAR